MVIDPTVDFTTFYGGNSFDEPDAIAVDNDYGDARTYIAGATGSMNFPTTDGTKFENTKNSIFWALFRRAEYLRRASSTRQGKVVYANLAGVGDGNSIAIDSTGVYITGETFPPDINNIIGYSDNDNGDLPCLAD